MKKLYYDFGNDDLSMPFEYEVDENEYKDALIKLIIKDYKLNKDDYKAVEKLLDDGMLDEDALFEHFETDLLDWFEDKAREDYKYGDYNDGIWSQSDFI